MNLTKSDKSVIFMCRLLFLQEEIYLFYLLYLYQVVPKEHKNDVDV